MKLDTVIQKLKESLKDIVINRNAGMAAYLIHRVTGIILTLFLCLHIWTLSSVFRGKEAYEHAIGKFDTTFGYGFQYVLLLIVAFHLLNGLRVTILDFFGLTRIHKKLLWIALFAFFIIAAIGIKTVLL